MLISSYYSRMLRLSGGGSCFDTISGRNRQTDGRTDTATHIVLMHDIERVGTSYTPPPSPLFVLIHLIPTYHVCFNTKFESWGPDPRVRVCNRMSTVLAHTDDIFKNMKS